VGKWPAESTGQVLAEVADMDLRELLEKTADPDFLNAQRLTELEVETLTGAPNGNGTADRLTHRNGYTFNRRHCAKIDSPRRRGRPARAVQSGSWTRPPSTAPPRAARTKTNRDQSSQRQRQTQTYFGAAAKLAGDFGDTHVQAPGAVDCRGYNPLVEESL
jgi:hypothetical protein